MSREAVAMVERKDEARNEDRRESPRVPMKFQVRRVGGAAGPEAHEGDLSLGGCAWHGGPMEAGAQVEVRFTLPGSEAELHALGEVLQVSQGPQGPISHARFVELPVDAELAIARYLDDVALSGSKG